MGFILYCAINPTDALSASKDAFQLISGHLPRNTPRQVWEQMFVAVQLVCEALQHKPITQEEYMRCTAEANSLIQRLAAPGKVSGENREK